MEPTTSGAEPQTFIVKTISGLEEVLAQELTELGCANVQLLKRAASFEGDKRMLYKANYCLRTAQRILMPIFSFQMADEDDLYININAYPWENYLDLLKTLAVDAVVNDSELTHSHYVALRTKDAIVDRFRTLNNGRRPSVDTENPDIRINIHINGSTCDVSIDSSGVSLHKRGYRVSNAEAPMSEVLAAGLIKLSGWKNDCHFIDPMCGSGTLLIEAAMIANNFPAGMYRKDFGFMHWPDFDEVLWKEVTKEALDQQTEFDYHIIGSDISGKNLSSARSNLKSARLHKDVKLFVSPFSALQAPAGEPGIVIINPPYGERIRLGDIIGLYKSIGNTLKQEFTGYQAWVISSDQKALSFIGLRPSAKLPVFNGQLECRFVHYDLYKGSKRGRYMDIDDQLELLDDALLPEKSRYVDKPSWRSKEAPPVDFSQDGIKPRTFRPRDERAESRFEPRERTERDPDSRRSDKPFRDDGIRKENKAERRKVEKVVLRPATIIFERGDQDIVPKNPLAPGAFIKEKEALDNDNEQSAGNKPRREPSKGNKFTAHRDSQLIQSRELRPRKSKADDKPTEPKKPLEE